MDTPNAFDGKTTIPAAEELSAVLGETTEPWPERVYSIIKEQGLDQE